MNTIHRIASALLVMTAVVSTAAAHDFSASYSHVDVQDNAIHVRFTLNLKNFHTADIRQAVDANYHIEAPDPPTAITVQSSDAIAQDVVLFNLVYVFDHPVTKLRITSTLERATQPDHSHFVEIGEGVNTREAVLNALNPSVEAELGEKAFFETSWDFVKL